MPNDKLVLLAALTYEIAYSVVPGCIFGDISGDEIEQCLTYPQWGTFLYFQHCQVRGVVPERDIAPQFQTHYGALDATRDYVVIEYPKPGITVEDSGILAPFFSGIVRSTSRASLACFVLGHAP